MTEAEVLEAQEKEYQLAQQDKIAEQTKEKKNALESYVYETRSMLLCMYHSFASDRERERISRSLQEMEDWLYDEGDNDTENAYILKLEDLHKLVDPVDGRYKDGEARAQARRDLLNCMVEYRMSVKSLLPKDRELIVDKCNKAEQWLREETQQQESLAKNTDPVLWSSDIKSKAEDLEMKCEHMLKQRTSSPAPGESRGPDNHTSSDS